MAHYDLKIMPRPTIDESRDDAKFVAKSLLTERQYAQFMQRSLDAVRRDRRRGVGPRHFLVGGSVRYSFAEIQHWLATTADRPPRRRGHPLVSVSP